MSDKRKAVDETQSKLLAKGAGLAVVVRRLLDSPDSEWARRTTAEALAEYHSADEAWMQAIEALVAKEAA